MDLNLQMSYLKLTIYEKFLLKPPDGSYGGGAFVKNLSKFLIENGYQITYTLSDIDIIFIIDRKR